MAPKVDSPFDVAVESLRKKHGAGVLVRVADNPDIQVNVVSSGVLSLDRALGAGGLPLGRIVEIFGPESAGKTTLALTVIAQTQRAGKKCLYIDSEHAFDPVYAQAIGVNVDDLWICQPDFAEQGLEVVATMVPTGEFAIAVIDSVPGMSPRAEIEGDIGDSHVGLMARMWSQSMRKLNGVCSDTDTMLLLINQLRETIGNPYGPKETTPGGRAIRFHASVRLEVRRIETQKAEGEAIGNRTRVKVVKNKVGAPFKTCEFDIVFGQGISVMGDLLDLSVDYNIVKKSGAWFSYRDVKLGQGRLAAVSCLQDNPGVAEEIRSLVVEILGKRNS